MKHLSVIISVLLFSVLCIGCIKEDYDIGKTNDVQNEHSLRLLVYTRIRKLFIVRTCRET